MAEEHDQNSPELARKILQGAVGVLLAAVLSLSVPGIIFGLTVICSVCSRGTRPQGERQARFLRSMYVLQFAQLVVVMLSYPVYAGFGFAGSWRNDMWFVSYIALLVVATVCLCMMRYVNWVGGELYSQAENATERFIEAFRNLANRARPANMPAPVQM